MNRIINLLLILVIFSAGSAQAVKKQNTVSNSDNEKIIRSQASNFAQAFSIGDAHAIASMWAPQGRLIDETGKQYKGRIEIENLYRQFFKEYGGQPLQVSIQSIVFPSPDVAIEEGISRLVKFPEGTMSRYVAVHNKKDGEWQMINVVETPFITPPVVHSLKDLNWLIGNWTSQGKNGKLSFQARFTDNNKFIHCTYQTITSDGNKKVEEQYIGWNPLIGEIESWNFDSDGGFARGYWSVNDKSWNIRVAAVSPDGRISRATYILSMQNNDKFTWQSKDRSVFGKKLPDIASLEVVREKQ